MAQSIPSPTILPWAYLGICQVVGPHSRTFGNKGLPRSEGSVCFLIEGRKFSLFSRIKHFAPVMLWKIILEVTLTEDSKCLKKVGGGMARLGID